MASRFEKFSERARRVLSLAQEEAQRFNHNYIGTEHILLGSDWVWSAMSGGLMDAVGTVGLSPEAQGRITRQNALDLFKV